MGGERSHCQESPDMPLVFKDEDFPNGDTATGSPLLLSKVAGRLFGNAMKGSLHPRCKSRADKKGCQEDRCGAKRGDLSVYASATEAGRPRNREYGLGKKVIVVGAGPGGLLAALLLAQRGYEVDILEKRPAPDQQEIKYGSRSIVFGLLPRGQAGLKEAGIRLPHRGQESVWLNGLALSKGAYSHKSVNGKFTTTFSPLPSSVLIVERAALVEHMILEMQRIQPERVRLLYGHSLTAIDFDQRVVRYLDDRGERCSAQFELLVGCDGRNSFVREALEQRDPDMRHEEHVAFRSYKGYHRLPLLEKCFHKPQSCGVATQLIAEGVDLGDETGVPVVFNVTGGFLEFSLTYWPTRHGTVTGHLSCPREWFEQNPNTPEAYAELIRDKFPAFPEQWIPETCRQLVEAKASPNGASIKCTKLHGPQSVILGDAAHGVTPAMGQGCNAALESAQIFAQVLDECDGDAEAAPKRFTRARLQDAHALFVLDREARSRSGSDGLNFVRLSGLFHIMLGNALKKLLPFWFKGPAYSALMGSNERYSKVKRALRRDAVLFVLSFAAAVAAIVRLLQAAFPPLVSRLMSGAV